MAATTKSAKTQASGAAASAANENQPVTVPEFLAAKSRGVRLTMLTAYDYTMARLLDVAGVDGILVGDSLGMVVQGHEHSISVTLDEVIYHTRCVARGVRRSLLVADMPFMSFQISPQQALENAGRLLKEGGARAVKLEGGVRSAARIEAIASADIPVMGHIGLTPQSVHRLGGFRVQRDENKLMEDALATEKAGAFAVVVECVPAEVAQKVTAALKIPTIGIGAGVGCDGQILVSYHMLGLFDDFRPRFVKQYDDLGRDIVRAVESYCREVREGKFPDPEHSFH
ncbi:MAG TPA: 3-methyl-2-oxobutanoate hydroxymethyltransferase [Gemmataceae bacterium]|nr:3-methyl-2-oxobutanoate hydroxymethyltransferase [Gemmataceae bacterium]